MILPTTPTRSMLAIRASNILDAMPNGPARAQIANWHGLLTCNEPLMPEVLTYAAQGVAWGEAVIERMKQC